MANLQHFRAQLTSRRDESEAKGKKCKAALDGLEVVGLSAADSAWARVLSGMKVAEDEVRKLDEQLKDLARLASDVQQAQEEKQSVQRELTYGKSEVEAALQDLTGAFETEQEGLALQKSRAEAKAVETKEQSKSTRRKAEEAAEEAEAAEARYNDAAAELTKVSDKHASAQCEHDEQLQRLSLEHEERSRPMQERLGDLDSLLKQYDTRINTLVTGAALCIDLTGIDDDTSRVKPGPPRSSKGNLQSMCGTADHATHLDDGPEAPRYSSRNDGAETELTTYKEGQSLNDTFPTIVYIEGEWWELHCSICGTNKRAGENRFLLGLRGFLAHLTEMERGQTFNLKSTSEYCKRRKCSAEDVELYGAIAAGGQHKRSSLPIKLVEGDSAHHRRVAAQLDSSDNETLSVHAVDHIDKEGKLESEMTVATRDGSTAVIKGFPSIQEDNHVSISLEARQTPTGPRKIIANSGVIHKSFPSVIRFEDHWIEVCCAQCGANSENGEFFHDMQGLASHVQGCHSDVKIDRVKVKAWCDKRNVDERDVQLMEQGRNPKITEIKLYTGDEAQGQQPVLRRLSAVPPPKPLAYAAHADERYSADDASFSPSLKDAGVVYPTSTPSSRDEVTLSELELPRAFSKYQPVIHRKFPMVTKFRKSGDIWYEICCAICGANMDNGAWFEGTRGVEVHVRTQHPEIQVNAANPQIWSNARRIAPRDATLMQNGRQPQVLAIGPYTGDASKGHPPVTRRLEFTPSTLDGDSRDSDDSGFSFRGAASGVTSKKRPYSPTSHDPRKRRSSPAYQPYERVR